MKDGAMQRFMSLAGGTGAGAVVRETPVDIPDGLEPGVDIFHADFAATLVPFVDGVAVGWVRQGDGSYAAPPEPAVDLDALKDGLKSQVDAKAETLRLTLITPGSGQAMEYQEAYSEAAQVDAVFKANASAILDPAAFPMLAASIGCDLDPTTGRPTADLAAEARSVLAAYDHYQKAGAAIRGARLRGKAAIDAAADATAAQGAFAAIAWPVLVA